MHVTEGSICLDGKKKETHIGLEFTIQSVTDQFTDQCSHHIRGSCTVKKVAS